MYDFQLVTEAVDLTGDAELKEAAFVFFLALELGRLRGDL